MQVSSIREEFENAGTLVYMYTERNHIQHFITFLKIILFSDFFFSSKTRQNTTNKYVDNLAVGRKIKKKSNLTHGKIQNHIILSTRDVSIYLVE